MPPPKETAIMKAPTAKGLSRRKPPALMKPVSEDTAKAETGVRHLHDSLAGLQSIITIANNGGEAAGWGLTCGGIATAIGVAIHSSLLLYFGPIGMTIGVGLFATRIFDRFRRFKRAEDKELNDRLEGNDLLFAAGKLTESEYNDRRKKILDSYN